MADDTFEREFWSDCLNTYDEERKQFAYALRMGLWDGDGWDFVCGGRSVLDIGGGPVSMLLKTKDRGASRVLDPGASYWPDWVHERYNLAGIEVEQKRGEDMENYYRATGGERFDEVWIYNVLQHTDDPERVLANAARTAGTIRIFEWIDIPAYEGHPQTLTEERLRAMLPTGRGRRERIADNGAVGVAFYGTFR